MTDRVDSVTIVGGGTAGWLTAVMLATFMSGRREGPPVAITLIESGADWDRYCRGLAHTRRGIGDALPEFVLPGSARLEPIISGLPGTAS